MTTTMPAGEFSLPDPPRGQSDEGNWVTHLSVNGNVHFLVHHFGREDTTIYGGRLYIVLEAGHALRSLAGPGPADRLRCRFQSLLPQQRVRHFRAGQAA